MPPSPPPTLRSSGFVLLVPFLRVKTSLHHMSEETPTAFPVVTGFLSVSGCPFPGVNHVRHGAAGGTAAGTTAQK